MNSSAIGNLTTSKTQFIILQESIKLEFPRFKVEEPASWVYKAIQYFNYHR